jgi:hypothetical protein
VGHSVWIAVGRGELYLSLFVRSPTFYSPPIVDVSLTICRLFSLLRPDPLHVRRFSVVRSRDKSQRLQTVARDCAAPLPQAQARRATAEFMKLKVICECAQVQRLRVYLIGHLQLQNTEWLGYCTNEVHAVANSVGFELHSRLVHLINGQWNMWKQLLRHCYRAKLRWNASALASICAQNQFTISTSKLYKLFTN